MGDGPFVLGGTTGSFERAHGAWRIRIAGDGALQWQRRHEVD